MTIVDGHCKNDVIVTTRNVTVGVTVESGDANITQTRHIFQKWCTKMDVFFLYISFHWLSNYWYMMDFTVKATLKGTCIYKVTVKKDRSIFSN